MAHVERERGGQAGVIDVSLDKLNKTVAKRSQQLLAVKSAVTLVCFLYYVIVAKSTSLVCSAARCLIRRRYPII